MKDETNAERLEIIRDKQMQMHALSTFDIDWLIQQAERAEVLNNHAHEVRKENIRLREALEFYALRQAYYKTGIHLSEIMKDYGDTARQALSGDPDD